MTKDQTFSIEKLVPVEVLDSRGRPTVSCKLILKDGSEGFSQVPSGASTGSFEACELRDNAANRYHGHGVKRANHNIQHTIAQALCGQELHNQQDLDDRLCALDGSTNKSVLGANAILAVSLAFAHAQANSRQMPLYRALQPASFQLPIPMMNLINGGRHAHNQLAIQEFMIVPYGLPNFAEAIRAGAEISTILSQQLRCPARGDEGGFAPDFCDPKQALDALTLAIETAGYSTNQVGIALDMASTEYCKDGIYSLDKAGKRQLDVSAWIDYIASLVDQYPIVSIEDPVEENDWKSWQALTREVGLKTQLVGDDVFVTQLSRLKQGVEMQAANAILMKPNQVGTLSELRAALHFAHESGYNSVMSHRSGETEDTTIADLAVGLGTKFIKSGALRQSDRVAKYNRLLWIEAELGDQAMYAGLKYHQELESVC